MGRVAEAKEGGVLSNVCVRACVRCSMCVCVRVCVCVCVDSHKEKARPREKEALLSGKRSLPQFFSLLLLSLFPAYSQAAMRQCAADTQMFSRTLCGYERETEMRKEWRKRCAVHSVVRNAQALSQEL